MLQTDTSYRCYDLSELIWEYYHNNARTLPWREPDLNGVFDPYKILVSEMMLQQTQVQRVIPKYQQFLAQFPTLQSLAAAPLSDVLVAWSGLGYNRRAKYLHEVAGTLSRLSQPWTVQDLVACKGIGANTAAAVVVYSYNQPEIFIETNVRTVLIHHCFDDRDKVADKELLPLLTQLIDAEHPREFYWALMDYGSHLKRTVGNASRASKHYAKQSAFAGSRRQLRGAVLRQLHSHPMTADELGERLVDERLQGVLDDLGREGLVSQRDGQYYLGSS